ncbi:CHAT domain-containing protein [Nocardia vinacea]|uniref:CHAT domain-containing protein n=1 Tax=Nocardia vinacea TaxID=96468 RepID=A0ABZ1YP65_9NOCA|nr:CHAT domain-containing protein [Nocardia vinacea]
MSDDLDEAVVRLNISRAIYGRFVDTGALFMLQSSVRAGEAAVAAAAPDHPAIAAILSNHAKQLLQLHAHTDDFEVLNAAIGRLREALAITESDDPDRSQLRVGLASALRWWFDEMRDQAALREAVDLFREQVAEGPADSPYRVTWLNDLANALLEMSEFAGEVGPLEKSIAVRRAAVRAAESADDQGAVIVARNDLGGQLSMLYERTGNPKVLREAVDIGRAVVAAIPHDHPDRDALRSNLAHALRLLFELTKEFELVEEARSLFRDDLRPVRSGGGTSRADMEEQVRSFFDQSADLAAPAKMIAALRDTLAALPPDGPPRYQFRVPLAIALKCWHERTGEVSALREVVAIFRDELAEYSRDDPVWGNALGDLGSALTALYEHIGDGEALDEAVARYRDAETVIPVGHPHRSGLENSLGIALRFVFDCRGDIGALEEAIALMRGLVAGHGPDDRDRAGALNNLALTLRPLFDRTGDIAVIDEIVALFRMAVAATGDSDYDWHLASALRSRYRRTGDVSALQESLTIVRAAMRQVPARDPRRAERWNELGNILHAYYDQSQDSDALDEAIAAHRAAVDATPRDHPHRPIHQMNLAGTLHTSFERTRDPAVLDEAIARQRAAIAAIAADHPRRAVFLTDLAGILRDAFRRTDAPEVLDEAVTLLRGAVAATDVGDAARLAARAALVATLHLRFERTGATAELREAVELGRTVVAATPLDHRYRAERISAFATALHTWFERTGDPPALDEAIAAHREALTVSPVTERGRIIGTLNNLANALQTRCEWYGDDDALDEAIRLYREAVAVNSPDPVDSQISRTNLGTALRLRFERTGNAGDVHEAVALARIVVAATSPDDPARPRWQTNLASALLSSFERTGAVEALDESIRVGRAAVAGLPADHPALATSRTFLANGLRRMFERFGDLAALDEAIALHRAALEATTTDDPRRATHLANLALVLRLQFQRNGDSTVLGEAVRAARDALDATPPDHHDAMLRTAGLANALYLHFDRTGNTTALREVIELRRTVLDATPQGHPDRGLFLTNFGNTLHALFDRTGDTAALDSAVAAVREAVAVTAPDDPDMAGRKANLGAALSARYRQSEDRQTLEEVVELSRAALDGTASDDPARGTYLNNLGNALYWMFERTGAPEFRTEARTVLAAALAWAAAPVRHRIFAGRYLARIEMAAGAPTVALTVLESVVELLPQLAARTLDRADREHGLGQVAGLAAQIAVAAVAGRRLERAVELLEQVRGVLIGETIDDRTGADELRAAAPDLADELTELHERITALDAAEAIPSERAAHGESTRRAAVGAQRRTYTEQWVALLDRIRARPGLDRFLRPPSIERLRRQAGAGPIVMVYADIRHGGALILSAADPVTHIRLPGLGSDDVFEQVIALSGALHAVEGDFAGRAKAQADILGVLDWLWHRLAGPVLRELNLPGDARARVFWCPVGPLALLPIYAAGLRTDSRQSVPERTVSSFITTVRALEHARNRPSGEGASAVIVAMPMTDSGAEDGVDREIKRLAELLPNPLILHDTAATHAAVADALAVHSIAHFACHGLSYLADPAASALVLSDFAEKPFTVVDLARMNLGAADLAYLSACSTTRGNPTLADEGVHLTAAIHLAGYRHVIGTLWPINDAAAAEFAADFYTRLTENGTSTPKVDDSARVLTEAICAMRANYPALPTRWAGYLHQGA